jgi:hypothetical protein
MTQLPFQRSGTNARPTSLNLVEAFVPPMVPPWTLIGQHDHFRQILMGTSNARRHRWRSLAGTRTRAPISA